MSVRRDAVKHVDNLAVGSRRERLGAGPDGVPKKMVFTSRCYPPAESWTGRWSWWHQVPVARTNGAGVVVLACERRDSKGLHVLGVPARWFREHRADLCVRDDHFDLFISAEDADLFTERRGSGGADMHEFLVR